MMPRRSEMATLSREYKDNESRQTAMKIAGDAPATPTETRNDGEGREFRELVGLAQQRSASTLRLL